MASSHSSNSKLTLAYDGSLFFGWQKTSEGPSIEAALERAINQILQGKSLLEAASRTDRGVHALGQIVACYTPKPVTSYSLFQRGVNALLPPSIRLLKAEEAAPSFHPTLEARSKDYRYFVSPGSIQLPHHRRYAWHVPYPLNIAAMRKAASSFLGEKDFAAFTNKKNNEEYDSTVRRLDQLNIDELPDGRLSFQLIGNQFLYKMARNLVGTLIAVGRGKIAPEAVPSILSSRNRQLAGMTAPASGLFLHTIHYD